MPKSKSTKNTVMKKTMTKQQFVSMLNARREMKYNTVNNEVAVPVNGEIVAMTQKITQGDSDSLRDGSQIEVIKIDFILSLFLNSAETVYFVRFIIFSDSQCNGSNPAVTDVITSTDPNASLTRNVTVVKRFKILHDVLIPFSIAGNSRATSHRVHLKMNHTVNYLGTTDVAASNGRGSLYYLMCGDLATNNTAYNADWAVSFYDS